MLAKQGGHQADLGGSARMERLGHRAELFAQAGRLRRGDAERHLRLCRCQLQQARAGSGSAEHAGRTGDVPAAIVMVRINRIADAARHFNADHHRIDQVTTGNVQVLAQREHGRRDRTGWMNDGFQMRVVEVEGMRTDAVQQGGVRNVDFFFTAEDRRLA